jgi:Ca2+-binding RTX toxin-like protein
MAFIVTDTAFDINNLNLSFFNSNIVASVTRLGQNITFNSGDLITGGPTIVYPDDYRSRSQTATQDLRIELLGSGFNQGIGGIPSTGTVNYFGIADPVSGTGKWWMWGFSTPIGAFLSAIFTNDPSDDRDLFLSILSGNDKIYLSESADTAMGGTGNDIVYGYGGNDTLYGGAGSDEIWGDAGNDTIYGDSGIDKAGFAGARSAYTITQGQPGVFTVTGPDGTDTLRGIEYAKFDDQTLQLSQISGNFPRGSGQLYLNPGNQSYGPVPGGDVTNVNGSNLAERVILAADANVAFDPSFVRGNDVVVIQGSSGNYNISANVAGITISASNGAQFRIPSFGTGGGLQLQFSNGVADIETNDGGNSFHLVGASGSQAITGTSVAIGTSFLTFA